MKKNQKKRQSKSTKITVKKIKLYWLYFVFGSLIVVLSLLFAPFWNAIDEKLVQLFHISPVYDDQGVIIKEASVIFWKNWGSVALGFILAALIVVYVVTIITWRLKKKNQHRIVRILTAIEFSIMILLIVGCILVSFGVVVFLKYIQIVGLALWIRGFVETFAAYYYDQKKKEVEDYPVWYLLLNICFVTFGTLLFAFGFNAFSFNVDLILQWIFVCILFIGGILLLVYGALAKPIRVEEPSLDEDDSMNKKENIEKIEIKKIEKIPEDHQNQEKIQMQE